MFKKFEIDDKVGNGSFKQFGDASVEIMFKHISTANMTADSFGELSEAVTQLSLAIQLCENAFQFDASNFENQKANYQTNTEILRDLNSKRIIAFVQDPREENRRKKEPVDKILEFAGL